LSWIPQYFLQSYKLNLTSSAFFAAGVFLGGVVGDTLGGVISDRIYERTHDRNKARRNLVVFGFLGSLVSMLPILFLHDVTMAALCLSAAFFFSEFTIGRMWAIPMHIAPRCAGSASGLMHTGSALAVIGRPAALQAIVPPRIGPSFVYAASTRASFSASSCTMALAPRCAAPWRAV